MSALFDATDLTVRYGGVQAVKGVSLSLASGDLITVLGANGAGKTSLLRGITGLVRSGGSVTLEGAELSKQPASARASAGMGHVLEGRHVFAGLTVAENLRLGSLLSRDPKRAVQDVLGLLPELIPMADRKAGRLSGGQQQFLAIARALAGDPKVLLLDEPTNGLAPILIDRTIEIIREVRSRGVAILLVEQRLEVAQALGSDVLILQRGVVVETVKGGEADLEHRVHKAYLA